MRSRVARHFRNSALIAALLYALACNKGAPANSSTSSAGGSAPVGPQRGGSLTVSLRSEPPTFNRLAPNAQHAAVDAVTRLAHAPLVRLNRTTWEPEPWLAEKWTVSSDGKGIAQNLRDGLALF